MSIFITSKHSLPSVLVERGQGLFHVESRIVFQLWPQHSSHPMNTVQPHALRAFRWAVTCGFLIWSAALVFAADMRERPSTRLQDRHWDWRFALPGTDGTALSMAFNGNRIVL